MIIVTPLLGVILLALITAIIRNRRRIFGNDK